MLEALFRRWGGHEMRSLVAFCHLSSRSNGSDGGSVYASDRGWISQLGLGELGSFRIDRHAPRTEALRTYGGYFERFFRIAAGDAGRSLGRAEVAEAYVHDFQYRCDIDLTGLQLNLTLSARDLERYRQFIGCAPTFLSSDYRGGWRGDLAISIPSPAFEFPEPRGSDPPYPAYGKAVRELRSIRSFKFDHIDFVKVLPPDRELPTDLELASITPEKLLRLGRS